MTWLDCIKFFSDKHCMQVATSGTFASANDVNRFMGVCKTRTGYLRMVDADGKMRIEKCGWRKMRITQTLRRKKREMWMAKKYK